MSRRILLVTGSRALTRDDFSRGWARELLRAWLPGHDDLMHGGAMGPDLWAAELAPAYGLSVVHYALDGAVYRDGRELRRWTPEARPHPLARDREMVASAARVAAAGNDVQVLGLVAPWSTTHGTQYTLRHAREAGLKVCERTCDT